MTEHQESNSYGDATGPDAAARRRTTLVRLLGLAAIALVAVACGGSQAEDGPQTRQVFVDYVHDEVTSSFLMYFPRDVTVRPGDTIEFRQQWTGEPHSVTMGTLVDEMLDVALPLMERYSDTPDEDIPQEAMEQFFAAIESLPPMLNEDDPENFVAQNGAQPCYLDEGAPPEDPATPCAPEDQVQPEFDGRQSYYNSGFIPYEGPEGNRFVVELADDIEPGVYGYYCNLHGPGQAGTITVVGKGEDIPSANEVARQAREEIEAAARPLIEAHERAKEGEVETGLGRPVSHPLAGAFPEDESVHAFVSEFIPETHRVGVGEPVTWTFIGPHTVSFRVPEYFSQITVEDDGTVVFNPDAILPVGGPGNPEMMTLPDGEEGGAPEDEEGGAPEGDEGEDQPDGPPPEPPPPPEVDAGEWDGRTFISSGVFWEGTYTLTFTRPGTYPYACLIHPQMVGAVVVEE